MVFRVAVVGCGVSGLSFSSQFLSHVSSGQVHLSLFEKSRSVSGRLSSKRLTVDECEWSFDHGAQYFTARDERFKAELHRWLQAGVAAEWAGNLVVLDGTEQRDTTDSVTRYVGTPRQTSIGRWLLQQLDTASYQLHQETRVTKILRREGQEGTSWSLLSESGNQYDGFDVVVVSVPAAQAVPLLQGCSQELCKAIEGATLRPCWALLLGFHQVLPLSFDGAFVNGQPISWIAKNSSKPGRPSMESWVVHASADWSEEHLEDTPDQVEASLKANFEKVTRINLNEHKPVVSLVHRWRFAIPSPPLENNHLWNAEEKLGVCGDWCGGPRIEGAFLSGMALANRVFNQFFAGPAKI